MGTSGCFRFRRLKSRTSTPKPPTERPEVLSSLGLRKPKPQMPKARTPKQKPTKARCFQRLASAPVGPSNAKVMFAEKYVSSRLGFSVLGSSGLGVYKWLPTGSRRHPNALADGSLEAGRFGPIHNIFALQLGNISCYIIAIPPGETTKLPALRLLCRVAVSRCC